MKLVNISNIVYWHILSLPHKNKLLKIYTIKQYAKVVKYSTIELSFKNKHELTQV